MWLFELGALVLKVIIHAKANGTAFEEVGTEVVDFVTTLGLDKYAEREVGRKFQKMEDDIAKSCNEVLDSFAIEDERKELICQLLSEVLKGSISDIELLRSTRLDHNVLQDKLKKKDSRFQTELDLREQEIYVRMLNHIAHIIINNFKQFPALEPSRSQYLIEELDELLEKNDVILKQLRQINGKILGKPSKFRDFEREYRKSVLTQYSYIYLFGADELNNELKKYKLSTAYVQLEAKIKDSEKRIQVEDIFNEKYNNIWLSGEAGSGKTTLISWLAINSANSGEKEIKGISGTIPLIIELRKYNSQELNINECINRVMTDSSYRMPEGWIEDAIESGRILFLVDGFDEVSDQERESVFEWVKRVDPENKCKKLFTSRPQVKKRPGLIKLLEVKMMAMNTEKVEEFVRYWHKAVLKEQLAVSADEAMVTCNSLLDVIGKSNSLRKLAANPLLCAMISALHYRRGMNVPTSKRDLYEACCKMLLESRDVERKIRETDIQLSYEKKKLILSKLAYNMMINNDVETSKNNVLEFLKNTIEDMGIEDVEAENLLKFLLERTGLIREPEHQRIDFVHRSFQEYLCAVELSRRVQWGLIEEKIGKEEWVETISLAMGYATKDRADQILSATLSKGEECNAQKIYLFYAIEYLSGALEADLSIRNEIKEKLENYLPPQHADCEQIAMAGKIAVPYLTYKEDYTEDEKTNCLYTLSLIGTREALRAIKGFFVETLSKEQMRIVGNMMDTFRHEELIEEEIPKLVYNYLKAGEGRENVISNGLMRVMCYLEDSEKKSLENMSIDNLTILDFDDEHEYVLPNGLYKKISRLTIDGEFESLAILNRFSNIEKLTVIARSEEFDVYSLNLNQSIYEMTQFQVILYKRGYVLICGKDLRFLHNCEELSMTFVGEKVELDLSTFCELEKLKVLEVSAEYALDFNYDVLENIEKLRVNCWSGGTGELPYELAKLDIPVECGDFSADEYF